MARPSFKYIDPTTLFQIVMSAAGYRFLVLKFKFYTMELTPQFRYKKILQESMKQNTDRSLGDFYRFMNNTFHTGDIRFEDIKIVSVLFFVGY